MKHISAFNMIKCIDPLMDVPHPKLKKIPFPWDHKPALCKMCGVIFVSKDALETHKISKHEESIDLEVKTDNTSVVVDPEVEGEDKIHSEFQTVMTNSEKLLEENSDLMVETGEYFKVEIPEESEIHGVNLVGCGTEIEETNIFNEEKIEIEPDPIQLEVYQPSNQFSDKLINSENPDGHDELWRDFIKRLSDFMIEQSKIPKIPEKPVINSKLENIPLKTEKTKDKKKNCEQLKQKVNKRESTLEKDGPTTIHIPNPTNEPNLAEKPSLTVEPNPTDKPKDEPKPTLKMTCKTFKEHKLKRLKMNPKEKKTKIKIDRRRLPHISEEVRQSRAEERILNKKYKKYFRCIKMSDKRKKENEAADKFESLFPSKASKHTDRTTEIVKLVEYKEREYKHDFSEYFEETSQTCIDKSSTTNQHRIKDKIKDILKYSGSVIDDKQREAMEELCKTVTKPFPCDQCEKTCVSLAALKEHTKQHTGNIQKSCTICNIKFENKKLHQAHRKKVHKSKLEHQCKDCDKVFRERSTYNVHKQAKHNGLTLKCKQCPKEFNNSGNFRRHVRQVHTDLKPYQCTKCDQFFGDSGNLKRHDRAKHLGIRIPCPDCDRSCLDKSDLKRHVKAKHMNITLNCNYCGVDFISTYGLNQHINKKHKETPTEYKCDVCPERGFLSTMDRTKHKMKAHGENRKIEKREFKCPTCKESFPSIQSRVAHLFNAHGIKEPIFKCEDCGKNFLTAVRLTFHHKLCIKKKNWLEDDSVPKGWKYKVSTMSQKKTFLLPDGKTILFRKESIEFMKNNNYTEEEIQKLILEKKKTSIYMDEWVVDDGHLPRGWKFRRTIGVDKNSYFFYLTPDGKTLQGKGQAEKYMKSHDYSEEDIEKLEINRKSGKDSHIWKDNDGNVPEGWKYRVKKLDDGRKYFFHLTPEGTHLVGKKQVVEYLKQKCLPDEIILLFKKL